VGDVDVLADETGALYRAQDVSIVRVPARPADLTAGEKWIHVSLRDQTLVAMEGDRPVYATVVSKHVSATMDDDAEGAAYSIEDVPWTMFYDHSFALHGAFWHERFGHPQSHGCVNLSAADAKWLFRWSGPTLPEGWYGMLATAHDPGARIVIE
jgi:lipoprotein-anchoring transpeptidase ErfK/SrfK